MEELFNTIITVVTTIKNFSKYFVVFPGALLFCPDKYLEQVRLLETRNKFEQWIAIVFWFSVSVITIDLLIKIKNVSTEQYRLKNQQKNIDKLMHSLNTTEKSVIFEIYKNDCASFPINNALVTKLNAQKIIERPNIGIPASGLNFSYCLQPWVVEWLNKHQNYFSDGFQRVEL